MDIFCSPLSSFYQQFYGSHDSGGATWFAQVAQVADSQNRAISVSIQDHLGAFGNVCPPF